MSEQPAPTIWRTVPAADGEVIADVTGSELELRRPSDILDLFAHGATRVAIADRQLHPDLFDLSTGFAGELVQKCVNYGIRMADVGSPAYPERSEPFRQFVAESNRGDRFVFVATVDEAIRRLEG